MPFISILINAILIIVGGAAVAAAVFFERPDILFAMFVATGLAFVLYAARQGQKAEASWLTDGDD
ncbi:MAG: hypothetical protein AAGJ29_13940 [Pseudomonadota bacterium]